MLICMLKLAACIIWAAMFYFLGHPIACMCPITYYVGVSGAMTSLAFEGAYETFVVTQLVLILLLPYMVHVALGGLQESGGVLLWSFLSPLGAAFFRSSKESITWFKVFLLSTLGLLGYDFYSHKENDMEQLFFFAMNIVGVLTIVFCAAVFFAQALEKEFERSEALLHDILPPSIAKRIQMGENPIVDNHEQASLLFADVVGFTKAAATLSPTVVIEKFLQDFFRLTDQAVQKRKLTKIKTIGDAYMVVGGIDSKQENEYSDDVDAAVGVGSMADTDQLLRLAGDMFEIVDAVNSKYHTSFEIRVGVHVGPVVAGVLGVKRFAFDVWGDTVNTASRMESHGKAGYIHMTEDAYNKVKHTCSAEFDFEWGGETDIKSKGKMTTFFARPKFLRDHEQRSMVNLDFEMKTNERNGRVKRISGFFSSFSNGSRRRSRITAGSRL